MIADLKYHFAMQKKTISLLLFHGSARKNALIAAEKFREKVRKESGSTDVAICFLRGQKPDLASALDSAVAESFSAINIIPLFLLPGAHVDEDIPGIVEFFKSKSPSVELKLLPCLVDLDEFCEMIVETIKKHA